ncbi:MAG: hypothetical protein LBS59_05745 [Puniceicoccales bacterium]|jgi:hypothetical protein|nr:hypothetical protein [Puniceicoccales bacterium]
MESTPENLPEKSLDVNSLNIGPEWAMNDASVQGAVPRHFREERGGYGSRNQRSDDSRQQRSQRPDRRGDFRPHRPHSPQQANSAPHPDHSDPYPSRHDNHNSHHTHRNDTHNRRRGGNDHTNRHPSEHHHGNGILPDRNQNRSNFSPRPAPVAKIIFFPEEKPFSVLIKAIKTSLRTYSLFEITRLILEKNDRFLVGCRPYDADENPSAQIYQSVPDQLPFLSESDAIAHVQQRYLDLFFKCEPVTIDPPKGVFLMVSRCGFTGEILGPPNYHGYQQTLREFHAARLPQVTFDRFVSRIESVRDKELIDQWLQRMTQITRFTPKEPVEGEPNYFDSPEAARNFLITKHKDKVVRACPHLRFPGKLIESLPFGPLRAAIEDELRSQRSFPLTTANSLRGRLRKLGFFIHKADSKDITYISVIERKFRDPGTHFTDEIQRIVDFIEKRPRIKINELPEKFLGISPPSSTENKKSSPTKNEPLPTPEATLPSASPFPQATTESAPEIPLETKAEIDAPADSQPAPETTADSQSETAAPPPPTSSTTTPSASPTPPADSNNNTAPSRDFSNPDIGRLLFSLRWLISEGYVTEFSDGSLVASPVLTEPQLSARTNQDRRKKTGRFPNKEEGIADKIDKSATLPPHFE